ncbi:cyclic nucleotide-binding domain-containing protein, partial [Ottowia sp.]|uniref:cyclic nucleotide-binding domain-containing protein n=1 Tax=Ottowia sp. TaxID=1898956 RepID=UPI00342EA17B
RARPPRPAPPPARRRACRGRQPGGVRPAAAPPEDLATVQAFRCKSLADGRRQILNFLLPGDFIGLQGEFADEATHGVEALTDLRLCVYSRAATCGRCSSASPRSPAT